MSFVDKSKKDRLSISFFFWNAILMSILLTLISYRYVNSSELVQDWTAGQFVYFFGFASGNFFLISLVLSFIIGGLPNLFRLQKISFLLVLLVDVLLLVYVVADTFVFNLYKIHLNLAMLQMTFFGGGKIVSFTEETTLLICGLVLLCFLVAFLICVASFQFIKNNLARITSVVIVLILLTVSLGTNLVYSWGFAKQNRTITAIPEILPLNRPLRLTRHFVRFGLIDPKDVSENRALFASSKGFLNYPLHPLQCQSTGKDFNILFIFVDALRADMMNSKNMPNTWDFAKQNIIFNNHYSNGNNTRHGIFSLFTGLPGSYWKKALNSGTPSILISALQQRNYEIGIFTGAPLNLPEFDATIFSTVKDLRVWPRGSNPMESDQFAIEDFEKWLTKKKANRPFFGFIFLDNVHGYSWPRTKGTDVFTPYWKNINPMELNKDFDPEPYFNAYKNAVLWTDRNIGSILDFLKSKQLLENTIVIISSDHGEEFNDNKLNYWGHGGNFTDAQIRIPLVIHWPGKDSKKIDYTTSGLDIVSTLLPDVLGCSNPTSDYSVGQSLWSAENRRNWIYSSGYSRDAYVEKDKILLLNKLGAFETVGKNYQKLEATQIPSYLPTIIEEQRRYAR